MTREDIERRKNEIVAEHGPWTATDIKLSEGIWTRDNAGNPQPRLRRFIRIIQDFSSKPISDQRFLDLACLEGAYSIELGLHGASVLGIEGRQSNIVKAVFAKECLGLEKVEFIQDDVRNISMNKYGHFDWVICSGILYHLRSQEACELLQNCYQMVSRGVLIDTHMSFEPVQEITFHGKTYHGHQWREHEADEDQKQKEAKKWASLDNEFSFEFSRPSLVNLLTDLGFTSVYDCLSPAYDAPQKLSRSTFVGIKGDPLQLHTQTENTPHIRLKEGSLAYVEPSRLTKADRLLKNPFVRLAFSLKRLLSPRKKKQR